MQYFFTDKNELMLHHGDAFTWTIPLIAKSMKEMCLNLVEFTNMGEDKNMRDEEEDEEFKELIEFVDNELNFTGSAGNKSDRPSQSTLGEHFGQVGSRTEAEVQRQREQFTQAVVTEPITDGI